MFQVVYTDAITGVTENIEIAGIRKPRPVGTSNDTEWTYIATDKDSLYAYFRRQSRLKIQKFLEHYKKGVVDCQVDISKLQASNELYVLFRRSIRSPELRAKHEADHTELKAVLAQRVADLLYYKAGTKVFEELIEERIRFAEYRFAYRLSHAINYEIELRNIRERKIERKQREMLPDV